jgi:aconitate hydratase
VTAAIDSLKTLRSLKVGNRRFDYFSLKAAEKNGLGDLSRLPFSLKVLLENLLRSEDGRSVRLEDIKALARWLKTKRSDREIAYRPARVLMQDFTGVPAVVDLAAMRDAMQVMGEDPRKINPLSAVDLVIDHSVMVDSFGSRASFGENVAKEYERNGERYAFLRWGQKGFANFRVVPPGTGICHQVNLEYLSQTVWTAPGTVKVDGKEQTMEIAYPDTLVGTDSHTTMVNGLCAGLGVGGTEAEAARWASPSPC